MIGQCALSFFGAPNEKKLAESSGVLNFWGTERPPWETERPKPKIPGVPIVSAIALLSPGHPEFPGVPIVPNRPIPGVPIVSAIALLTPGFAEFPGVPNAPNRQIPGVPNVSTFRSSGYRTRARTKQNHTGNF